MNVVGTIAGELSLKDHQVAAAIKLLFEQECTVPFVARYRKEMTGGLDEVALRSIRDRHEYLKEFTQTREKYLKAIKDQDKLTSELAAKFASCTSKQELDDLYLPFKPKRRTRAQVAREKGLEILLDQVLAERYTLKSLADIAQPFVTPAGSKIDPSIVVATAEDALAGCADILAERISETPEYRAEVRRISQDSGILISKKIETPSATSSHAPKPGKQKTDQDLAAKYQNYFDYHEPISRAPSHRVMAVRRGEAEKVLRLAIEVDVTEIIKRLRFHIMGEKPVSDELKLWFEKAIDDAYHRLIAPSIETEIRLQLKTRAEEESIKVFAKNLSGLLMLPPIPGKIVLGIDPGFRTGCKLAAVSETGRLLEVATIHPEFRHTQQKASTDGKVETAPAESPKTLAAKQELLRLITKHKVEYIAIGNGTGSKEIDTIVIQILKAPEFSSIKRLIVNEAGASVYSADPIAREEFPDLEASLRSAVSIARRLQDPLAELVKIDPRSIGVGQYQHDVNVNRLKTSLEDVVESCVNKVGVNLNTASYKLLGYVSGIGPAIAKQIVTQRDKMGGFKSRQDLVNVSGFGPKAFEQAAGFLRIPDAPNPLDNSSVHPERYEIVQKIADDLKKPLGEIIGSSTVVNAIPWENYVTASVGMPTLKDIAQELIKPGRDPREEGSRLVYSGEVTTIEDLKVGMELMGTVTNVTNFGVFVDIGVHQDGMVHISELSDQYVRDPAEVASPGDVLKVRVIDVDLQRKRISLSSRAPREAGAPAPQNQQPSIRPPQARDHLPPHGDRRRDSRPQEHQGGRRPQDQGRTNGSRPPHQGQRPQQRPQRPPPPKYTIEDLLNKFNGGQKK